MDLRNQAIRRVMKTVARYGTSQPLPVRLEDGSRPIVVALPDDTLGQTLKSIESFGARANVFVSYAEGLKLVAMSVEHGESQIDDEVTEAKDTTTMAMYVSFLQSTENGYGAVRLRSSTVTAPQVSELAYAL